VRDTVEKLLTRATTLLKSHFNQKSAHKVMGASKSWESQLWQFQDSHLGVLKQKSHLDVGLVERHIVYYKGEGGGFPQVRAVMSLVSSSLPMVRPSTKNVPTMH